MNLEADIRWKEKPFCLLNRQARTEVKNQAQIGEYSTGDEIWNTDYPGNQFLIISGKVRLKEKGKSKSLGILKAGDWIGDLLELSGQFKATASNNVVVVCWDAALWTRVSSKKVNHFWNQQRSHYQPQNVNLLWQVEQTQKQEKFSLSWFVPAIWKYHRLLGWLTDKTQFVLQAAFRD